MRSELPAVEVGETATFANTLETCDCAGSFVLGTSLRAAVNLVITLLRLTRKKCVSPPPHALPALLTCRSYLLAEVFRQR